MSSKCNINCANTWKVTHDERQRRNRLQASRGRQIYLCQSGYTKLFFYSFISKDASVLYISLKHAAIRAIVVSLQARVPTSQRDPNRTLLIGANFPPSVNQLCNWQTWAATHQQWQCLYSSIFINLYAMGGLKEGLNITPPSQPQFETNATFYR